MKPMQWVAICLVMICGSATAHHNPVVYDGKRTVQITGVVKTARFAFPHSRYLIDVTAEDGSTARWTLMTEDPKDAKSLGFDDELRAIKVGDTITVVGWPNKVKDREIRGHQLHYPDGRVVMMRRGNYIWTSDLRRIWRLRSGADEYPKGIEPAVAALTPAGRVISWIHEGDAVARIALEIEQDSAALIGIDRGDGFEFDGVEKEFECHTEDEHFRLEIDFDSLSGEQQKALSDGSDYIENYNDLLATYWEYDIASCS